MADDKKPLWKPSEDQINRSRLVDFIHEVNDRHNREISDYHELWQWSVTNIEDFWATVWDQSGINASKKYDSILASRDMPGARWFTGARLNFAENLLRFNDNHVAIVARSESREKITLTHTELRRQVAACADGLKKLGVSKGDRVAGFIPNIPEAVIAMLATTSLGAIWSSCSPDFGLQGVYDRFGQIEPKVLICADGYTYGGKRHDSLERVRGVVDKIDAIEKVVVIPYTEAQVDLKSARMMLWSELLTPEVTDIEFAQLPFDHPVYIMYSSGTTGVPKCIVHGAGGTLLQHWKEHALHTDLDRDDVLFYFTTCGWMMWNWLVSGLFVGSTIYLYDGSPAHPDIEVLWRAAEEDGITVFGTSPKYLSSVEQMGFRPGDSCDLSKLRAVLSTGSPLSERNFEWVYSRVKTDLQLSSISGGTDIVSCFMLGCPTLPVYSGEIQCRGLGMKVECYDDHGKPLIGQVGELVCTEPAPSMPIYFWNDPDMKKYRSAYFEDYDGIWRHGDFIKITPRGTVIVYGRSDATLNPGGVRIGTAEIYAPVEGLAEVADSIVVGRRHGDDVQIVLFVVPADGQELNEALRKRIRETIRSKASPRHVPKHIFAVSDVPRTISGKKVELAVTRTIHGENVTNRDALANPDSLQQYADIAAEHFPTK